MQVQPTPEEIQAAALADWEAGKVGKEFTAKQQERGVTDSEIARTLKSQSSIVARYSDQGQPRYGFWHQHVGVFIAWQPAEGRFQSELKTCIPRDNGYTYMAGRDDFELVRGQR